MPETKKKTAIQENLEFQKKEFPARIAAVKKTVKAALAADKAVGKGHKPLTREERGKHQAALRAAERVERRLKGPAPSSKDVTKPGKKKGKKKSTPESRRRVVEEATGTSTIIDRLRGINALMAAGKKKKKGG